MVSKLKKKTVGLSTKDYSWFTMVLSSFEI